MPKCEICNSQDFELIATQIREGEGKIAKCKTCGLVIQDLNWSEQRLRDYYENEYQVTNSLVSGKKQSVAEHYADRVKTIDSVFNCIRPLLRPESRVLEVGCGSGSLLSRIKPYVAYCAGVELHTPFVDFIKNDLAIEAFAVDVNKLKLEQKFDLIISISTLDHLPNPLETLTSMKNLLAPSGRIYLEIPNLDEALNCKLPEANRKKYNTFFWHRAHLFYFSRMTAAALFEKIGMKVDIRCRHEYTLKNFLNWYYTGTPQKDFVTGLTDTGLFKGDDFFETEMNKLFADIEPKFKQIMADSFGGDNLCCTGYAAREP